MVKPIAESASLLEIASIKPERLLLKIKLRTGETSRKNNNPLNAERANTKRSGKPGDKRNALHSSGLLAT
jgi:hypothetical protein